MPEIDPNDKRLENIGEYKESKRLYECDWCGTIFYRKHMNTRYCCNDCKKNANKANKHEYYLESRYGSKDFKKEVKLPPEIENFKPKKGEMEEFLNDREAYIYRMAQKKKRIRESVDIDTMTVREFKELASNCLYTGNGIMLGDFRTDEEVYGKNKD